MSPLLLSVALLAPAQPAPGPKANDVGVLPIGADGKPLNLDFETGDLKDWTADGMAFKGQPVKGDTVKPRRADMQSRHQGQFWIGGYEKLGDKPTGTLTSVPFKVTHPWASFLVGGGPHATETCVEIVSGKGAVVKALDERGVLVRSMNGKTGIDGSFRLTVGTLEQMKRFFEVFEGII